MNPLRFELLTAPAQQSLDFAQRQAERYRHGQIDTEHVLLGLLTAEDGGAARALREEGIQIADARAATESRLSPSEPHPVGRLTVAPSVKKVLEVAFEEAHGLGLPSVSTGALLLGLLQTDGIARQVLTGLGIAVEPVRARVASGPQEPLVNRRVPLIPGGWLAAILFSQAESLRRRRRFGTGRLCYSWASALFGASGNWHDAGVSFINLSLLHVERGDYSAADRSLERAEQIAQRVQDANLIAVCTMNRGHLSIARGDLESARFAYAQRLALAAPGDAPDRLAALNYNLAWIDFIRGAFSQAEARIGDTLADARPVQPELVGLVRMLSGRLLMRRGEFVAAASQLELAAAAFGADGSRRGLALVDLERSMVAFCQGGGLDLRACERALAALADRTWRDALVRRLFSLYAVADERAHAQAPALLALLKRPVEQLARADISATLAALRQRDGSALASARNALKAEPGPENLQERPSLGSP